MKRESDRIRSQLALAIGFALLLVAAGSAIALKLQQDGETFWVKHSVEVEKQLNRVYSLVVDAESSSRGFLITGREPYLEGYVASQRDLPAALQQLSAQVADNPRQAGNIAALQAATADKMKILGQIVDARKQGDLGGSLATFDSGRGFVAMERIHDAVAAMRAEEQALYAVRAGRAKTTGNLTLATLVIATALVMLLAMLALREARVRVRELRESNDALNAEVAARVAADGQVRQLVKIQSIGQLTGGIAHDFNNMLTIIIGSLEMARRRLTGDEAPAVARGIAGAMEGATRAAALTARLLAFSRQQPLNPQIVDLNKLVGSMSDLLRRAIGESIGFETVLSGGLWRTSVDVGQVENAIVNLAINARDAMPEGGKLTIETANADLDDRYASEHSEVSAGQYVVICITDTGTGMTADVVERAVEPFYTTKGAGQGSGLGLSQVYGFVKQSNGHMKIYSEPGHGTTIKIYFPRSMAAEDAGLDRSRVVAVARPGSAAEVVLVCEDEASVRRVSVESLRELGYTVIEAATPSEALAQLERDQPISLLFTDIVMPEMSGRVLADKAVALRPGLPVLYTTGYSRNAIVHNGVLDPGTNFLAKPFTLDQLAAKVRDVLDKVAG